MPKPRIRTTIDLSPEVREKLENLKESEENAMRDIVEEAIIVYDNLEGDQVET